MVKGILLLPVLLFSCGLGNKDFLSKQGEINSRMVNFYSNTCHEVYEHHSTPYLFSINYFRLSAMDLMDHKKVTISYEGADYSQALNFTFRVYDEDDRCIDEVSYFKSRNEGINRTFTVYFENVERWSGLCKFVFNWHYIYNDRSGTFALFYLRFSGGTLEPPYYEMVNPYYAEVYPDQGYSEIFGDYVRIKNLKELYEIPVYGKFDLNDLGIIYYLESLNPSNLRGQILLYSDIETRLKNQNVDPELANQAIFYYRSSPLINLSFDKSLGRDDSAYIVNNKNNYYNPSTYEMNNGWKSGYKATKAFYLPRALYPYLKEVKFTISFPAAFQNSIAFGFTINVRFLKANYNTTYEVVGEIDNEIIDDDLEEVIIP